MRTLLKFIAGVAFLTFFCWLAYRHAVILKARGLSDAQVLLMMEMPL